MMAHQNTLNCWDFFHDNKPVASYSDWRRQYLEIETNPVYKLANVKKTGELLRLYEKHGEEAVRNFCKTKIKEYLYHQGNGSYFIQEEDYYEWRRRLAEQETTEPVSRSTVCRPSFHQATDETKDESFGFVDHEACWDLNFRGAVGETVLHLCYLHNSPAHLEIAKILLDLYPKLALDIYEAEEYYGESALHFAVIHGNLESVKLIVEKGAAVNQRATGRFFLPEDQKKLPKAKTSNYEGDAYYGEYPLAFAACLGFKQIYDYLQSQGADPDLQDSFGNTVLHMTVIKNKPAMYSHAAKHLHKKADNWKKNYDSTNYGVGGERGGLTPLALANKLGRLEVFNEILELNKEELWTFSNKSCSIYPLHALDTIGPDGRMNWNSSLMITLDGKTDEHVDMLQSAVLKQLLDEKWKNFVKKIFLLVLAIVLFHLIVLTTSVILRSKHQVHLLYRHEDYFRAVAEIFTMFICLAVLGFQINESIRLGFRFSFHNLMKAPFKAIYFVGCLLQLALIPIRVVSISYPNDEMLHQKLMRAEEVVLIISLPMTWTMILFFAEFNPHSGSLLNLLFIYFRRSLLPFLTIVMLVFITFAVIFHQMYKTIEDSGVTTFATIHGSVMSLFHFTLGAFEYDEFEHTSTPALTMIVFILFMLLMPIVLLNMLIAMMTSTFEEVVKKSEKHRIIWRARIIIALEQIYPPGKLLEYQQKYFSPINDIEGKEHRGIMVIKTASKTKSKQTKDAVRNGKGDEH